MKNIKFTRKKLFSIYVYYLFIKDNKFLEKLRVNWEELKDEDENIKIKLCIFSGMCL